MALAEAYHRLNRIEQVISRCVGIAEFTCCLQVVPGNPKRIFDQCWHRFGHKAKTPSGSTCSFRQALERTGPEQTFRGNIPELNISHKPGLYPGRLRLFDWLGEL